MGAEFWYVRLRCNVLLYLLLSLVVSCSMDDGQGGAEHDLENTAETKDLNRTGIRLYTLPAPLQIATAIRLFDLPYSEELLSPTNYKSPIYPTSYLQALNLGIYGVDMGYVTIFEKHQTAIHYSTKVVILADELNIAGGFQPSLKDRFERNMSNQDSLYYIILESFNNAHLYLQENNRALVGLLISTGGFIEGLYLATEFAKQQDDVKLVDLIARQQVFLDNIRELLADYADKDNIAQLLEFLATLKDAYIVEEKAAAKTQKALTKYQIIKINAIVTSMRNEIVG